MCFGAYKYSYMWCDSWTSPNPGIDLGSSLNLGLRPWPESPGVLGRAFISQGIKVLDVGQSHSVDGWDAENVCRHCGRKAPSSVWRRIVFCLIFIFHTDKRECCMSDWNAGPRGWRIPICCSGEFTTTETAGIRHHADDKLLSTNVDEK